jgi:hypothetical protein
VTGTEVSYKLEYIQMVPISDPLMPIGFVDSIPDEVIAFFN